jgi:hypothetical protein
VWSRRPDAGVKFVRSKRLLTSDGGKKAGHQGEREVSRKTIARGRPLNLYARVRISLCSLHTRPRVQRAPGLPCALLFEGASFWQTSGASCREIAKACRVPTPSVVIPGRAKRELRCAIAHLRIHTHDRGCGFRACAKGRILRCAIAHRGMTRRESRHCNDAWRYSTAAPTGGPPGGRCKNVIDANAPIHEPIAAKAT